MRLTIIGATGRLGGWATTAALAGGHEVVAHVSRQPDPAFPEGVTTVVGALEDSAVLQRAIAGSDAVIAAMGARSNDQAASDALAEGMRALVAAMEAVGVSRLVALSGPAVDVPGDRKPWLDRVTSRVVRRVARHVEAKQREYEIFAVSTLA
jgi:putative NADH-flavin reductase